MDLSNIMTRPLQAGKLRHRIVIEQQTTTQGTMGGVIKAWTTFATVWAAIDPQWGKEEIKADKNTAETGVRILIRYLDGVNPSMRVRWARGAKTYDIVTVLPSQERRVETQLICREVI